MKRIIITFGLIYGIFNIISGYLMLNQTLSMWTLTGVGFLVAFIVYFLGIRNFKTENGGFASFRDAFQVCMGITLIGFALSFLVNQVYVQTMSQDSKDELATQFVDSQVSMYADMGVDTEEIEEALSAQADDMFSVKSALIQSLTGLILMGVISVIFALIFKKDPPIGVV